MGHVKHPKFAGFLQNKMRDCLIALLVLAFAMIDGGFSTSYAQSSKCNSLRSQLASVGSGGGGNKRKYQQYSRAVKAQKVQLNKTIRASRKCGFSLSSKCRRIKSSIKKMKANLNSLSRTQAKFAPKSSGKRSSIERALRKNRCYDRNIQTAKKNDKKKGRRQTLLEQIFGVKTYSNDGNKSNADTSVKARRNFKTVRTLCVRTCDGYYFPVSFSTTKNRLRNDFDECQRMCPGTETALFYHKMPGQDAEESISYRTGQPYSSLENAFAYRNDVNSECSCRFAQEELNAIAGEIKPLQEVTDETVENEIQRIGLPIYRQDPSNDPDSLENELGRLDLAELKELTSKDSQTAERTNSNIRIVGPAFFPVQ